jgi:hypothetical protein
MGDRPTDDEHWDARLTRDAERLHKLLSPEDHEILTGAIEIADEAGGLDFLVVYGSVARGERRADSDLDIYFEARDLPKEFNRKDPAHRWHIFGLPAGALLDNLRRGRQFAFDLIGSALVSVDRGAFRALVTAVAVEGLEPSSDD